MQVNQSQVAMDAYTLNIKGEIRLSTDSSKNQTTGGTPNQNSDILQQIKDGKVTGKDISNSYLFQYSIQIKTISVNIFQAQNAINGAGVNLDKVKELLKNINAQDIGYDGKPLDRLTTDEAKKLVADDGFFGVTKTAQRIADFVINGSGGDINMLKAGKEGMLKGFSDAEQAWGDKLPDIAYQTIKKATESVDKQIEKLGGKVLDSKA